MCPLRRLAFPDNGGHHGVAGVDVDFKNRLATAAPVHAIVRRTAAATGYTSSVTVAEYFSIAVTLSSAGHICYRAL